MDCSPALVECRAGRRSLLRGARLGRVGRSTVAGAGAVAAAGAGAVACGNCRCGAGRCTRGAAECARSIASDSPAPESSAVASNETASCGRCLCALRAPPCAVGDREKLRPGLPPAATAATLIWIVLHGGAIPASLKWILRPARPADVRPVGRSASTRVDPNEGDEIAGGPASDAELEAALLVELRAPPRRT